MILGDNASSRIFLWDKCNIALSVTVTYGDGTTEIVDVGFKEVGGAMSFCTNKGSQINADFLTK